MKSGNLAERWKGTGKETSQVVERWESPLFPSTMEPASPGPGTYVETILVVDDEDDIRTVVRKMLEAKGYTVLDTGDPQQAYGYEPLTRRVMTGSPVRTS